MSKINVVDINSEEFLNKVLEIFSKNQKIVNSRFVRLSDGWIKDLNTNLEWGPSSSGSMNFSKAQEYCKSLSGRLPTVDELQTILDRTMHNPTCDKSVFKDVKSEWYWTSTKYAGNSSCSWCVSFLYGDVCGYDEYGDFYVRPVRSSQ